MPEPQTNRDRVFAILVLMATLAMIAVNALAAAGLINGITPATVSLRNPSMITPAGYAFSIWCLIYLWLLAFSIYQLLPRNFERFTRVRILYLASCVLNCAWIWCWHHGLTGVCLMLIAALTAVLILIVQRLPKGSLREELLTGVPLGLYAGWVTCAALVNLNILAMRFIESWSALLAIGIVSILAAAGSSMIVVWKLKNYVFPLAAAWALTAIAVKQGGNTSIVIAAAFGTVACLVTAGSVVTNLKDSTSGQR
jgi:benzodiazapine receptor